MSQLFSGSNNPEVVLIVNCYNSGKYLNATLGALVSQTYDNISILCVDNHSTDDTVSIISDYIDEVQSVSMITTDRHMPLVNARHYAIEYLKRKGGFDYFGFCDSDDLWDCTWVESLIRLGNGYDLIYSNGYELLESGEIVPVESCIAEPRHDAFSSPIYLQSFLLSTKYLSYFDSDLLDLQFPMHYDIDLFLRLKKIGVSYVHISDKLFKYRVHSNSLGASKRFDTFVERYHLTRKHSMSFLRFLLISLSHTVALSLRRSG